MADWQPIATAPKDGTKIDVWVRSFVVGPAGKLSVSDVGRLADVWWGESSFVALNPYERKIGPEGWVHTNQYNPMSETLVENDGYTRVTHWMPLPAPPNPASCCCSRSLS